MYNLTDSISMAGLCSVPGSDLAEEATRYRLVPESGHLLPIVAVAVGQKRQNHIFSCA